MQTQLHSVYKGSQEYSLSIQGLKITRFGDINPLCNHQSIPGDIPTYCSDLRADYITTLVTLL